MKKARSVEELQSLVQALAWNDGFGCFTRQGFEKAIWPEIAERAKWIVYFDVDGMHELNESFGNYEPVDRMISDVLSAVRDTDYVAGQWKSGDEFLVCLTERDADSPCDPYGLMERLVEGLKVHGMSATFAVVPVTSTDLAVNVQPAVDQVYAQKKSRKGRQR